MAAKRGLKKHPPLARKLSAKNDWGIEEGNMQITCIRWKLAAAVVFLIVDAL